MSFKRLQPEDIVISTDSVAGTVWSDNVPTLTNFFTSSIQTQGAIGQFYYSIYQTTPSADNSAVQFDIAYCDEYGSGSEYYNTLTPGYSPTGTNYGQYLTLILADENSEFTFGNQTSDYFYVINLQRARYKQSILPGSLILKLQNGSEEVTLTDDSQAGSIVQFTDAGRVYNIVSGSAGSVNTSKQANGYTTTKGSYGLLLPDIDVLLLNGAALDANSTIGGISLGTGRNANTVDNNPEKLYNALESGSLFTINNEEVLSSDFIFVRARNNEFNYSENPSFISGSTGELVQSSFVDNPQTYITTVGMYNDSNELLAVAKLSRPLPKDFTKEMLVRVKLDF
jgi:hypothetical protein